MTILFTIALRQEYTPPKLKNSHTIYTGIGKLNAAITLIDAIHEFRPSSVINIGTAGSLSESLVGEVFQVKEVIERDMLAEPLAPRGEIPFEVHKNRYFSDVGHGKCASGDSFVTKSDPWLLDNNVDVFDMELIAIARVCNHFQIPWRSMKFVTDHVGGNSGQDWLEMLSKAQKGFDANLTQTIQDLV